MHIQPNLNLLSSTNYIIGHTNQIKVMLRDFRIIRDFKLFYDF